MTGHLLVEPGSDRDHHLLSVLTIVLIEHLDWCGIVGVYGLDEVLVEIQDHWVTTSTIAWMMAAIAAPKQITTTATARNLIAQGSGSSINASAWSWAVREER